ncbi:thiazole biosynthesis adenylyltransferase ThiF [Paenibacillus sp. JCM 10914]|uniref:ThiF family adenylyltransferase n=1 Tax=Paenibacillus sp. JCM 10914 TaxID=1236974 RepID=UPI0003CC2934|nr:ThiF family adenylyltransferase [Paenibacillus sp. JCM 10914]GAE05375.1 molybdopterin biosynthesis protein MoeB [Paenibacillus sp. JCM 10914]
MNEETEQIRVDRYSRQIRFAPFGKEGQARLRASHVLVVGAGALGSSIAETLVRAGVGTLTMVDRDYVEWSNLQRQQLYTENDAIHRLPKAIAAAQRLREINSECRIHVSVMDARANELEQLCQDVQLIMDATDNFETRLIVNDLSYKYRIPWIYGGCVGSSGVSFTFRPGATPCLNCLLGHIPLGGDTCDVNGILPQAVQMVTSHQTMEAMKWLAGQEHMLRDNMISFDVWRNEQVAFRVDKAKKEDCPTCGGSPDYPYLSAANVEKSEVLCGRDTVQIRPASTKQLELRLLAERLNQLDDGTATLTPYMVIYQNQHHRLVIFADGRALIHGTSDLAEARSIYHKFVGG